MFKLGKVFILFIIILVSCAQDSDFESITMEQFINMKENDSSLVILDVRTAEELVGPLGKIDEAVHIPLQELAQRVDELNKHKNQSIAVICRSGNRSKVGTKILMENGFKAFNVEGGMRQYRKEIKEEE